MRERPEQRPTSQQYQTFSPTGPAGTRAAVAPPDGPGEASADFSAPAASAPGGRANPRRGEPAIRPGAAPVGADPATPLELARLQAQAHQICPGCGTTMIDRGCKVRCLRCGFFLDCSDG
jgi:hypothetical protein